MRVLFYGGCHAVHLRNLFDQYADGDHRFDCLVNFRLIDSGKDFPQESYSDYDAIVMSPIVNQDRWNTNLVVDRCKSSGVLPIVYPWPQWSGYFPGAVKHQPENREGTWRYQSLISELALRKPWQVCDDVIESRFPKIDFVSYAQQMTENLATRETNLNVSFRISNFIEDNFRKSRLFLTPDHPSILLYNFISAEIASILNINLIKSYIHSGTEVQYGLKLPIFPAVSKALGLNFFDSDYQNVARYSRSFAMSEYIKLEYSSISSMTILSAQCSTFAKPTPSLANRAEAKSLASFNKGDLLVGIPSVDVGDHLQLSNGEVLRIEKSKFELIDPQVFLFKEHWTRVWF